MIYILFSLPITIVFSWQQSKNSKMPLLNLLLPALFGLPAHVLGANLLASHYIGKIFSLALNNNALSITSTTTGAGNLPAWLRLDSTTGTQTLYSVDEDWNGSGTLASFTVGANGALTPSGKLTTSGGSVHGTPYANAKFFATVE
jgi:hypothetical protein